MALFAVAPALGLAALTGHEISSSVDSVRENDVSDPDDADPLSFEQGGAGTPAQDVVNWMKALELGPPEDSKGNPKLWVAPSFFHAAAEAPAGDADAMLLRLPLTLDSGTAVAVAYLEHLVSTGESLAVLHNELGYLLLEGVLKARKATDGERGSAAANKVESAYRGRLRYLLKTSTRYHAAHVVSWLPDDFVLEKALVLARLERHYDVLRVYAVELRDDALAEAYCDEVWRRATARRASVSARRGAGDSGQRETDADDADDAADGAADDALDVYLILAKCYYQGRGANEGQKAALDLLTRHMARVDPMKAVSDVLPKNAKCAGDIADFISRLVRFWESERRAADVEHQLLRMEFVNLKYELTQQQLRQQSKMSAVPELARLGRVRRSLPPVSLSEGDAPGRAEPYAVACTRHLFESHVVLQFHVTNNSPMQHLQNVRVRVESLGDADLYAHDAEVPLKALPFRSTGSCYVVFRTYPTVGVVTTAFACELRFSVVSTSDSSGGTSYLEEILLRDLELATGDA